jgi:hypothetical protein
MSTTEAPTTLLRGAAMPTNGKVRAGDQTSISRTRSASRSHQCYSPAPTHGYAATREAAMAAFAKSWRRE